MSSQQTLNQLIAVFRSARESGDSSLKPVFWLGAGCSVYDGVPLNSTLLAQALPPDPESWGSAQFRFDQYCSLHGEGASRASFLRAFFTRSLKADSPYRPLVRVLKAGYADLIFTFNIDDLLEQALEKEGCRWGRDYVVIDVPSLRPTAAVQQVAMTGDPRIRLVKLHGDYKAGFNYMTSEEITKYDTKIRQQVEEFSRRPAIVCGYSFFHLNVIDAFSREGGPIFYVNLTFPDSPIILSLMKVRSRGDLFIDSPLGDFEHFAPVLATKLQV